MSSSQYRMKYHHDEYHAMQWLYKNHLAHHTGIQQQIEMYLTTCKSAERWHTYVKSGSVHSARWDILHALRAFAVPQPPQH